MDTQTLNRLPDTFEITPQDYRHIRLEVDGSVARILLDIQEENGLRPDYRLKLNSYDLGVDLELADVVQRLRFEHPGVAAVIITSANPAAFSAGANIFMLRTSHHGFKVNFCKFTNETRLYIEDATEVSGQTYIAALNGIASGGGYELALACEEIYLVDDRRSAVALPEVAYLGVLPGTGGLTRMVDKRKVRRDRADIFCTLGEGIKGKRARDWRIVDDVFAPSVFEERVAARAREIAGQERPQRSGIQLPPLDPEISDQSIGYRHVKLILSPGARTARFEITLPDQLDLIERDPQSLGAAWFPFAVFREIDDALLRLRFHYPEIGLVLVRVVGPAQTARAMDEQLERHAGNWFVHEVRHFIKRVLKRMDVSAKSFFAIVDPGTSFVGTFIELALAGDRTYMLDQKNVTLGVTTMNQGHYPMANGLTRLNTRLLGEPETADRIVAGESYGAEAATELGLATDAFDDIDWDDELRLAIEERASLSPDALTGMEASLRFAGPETLETKIFGRLSAWQNWIFQRPNAIGKRGALTLYGQPESVQFDWQRT